MRIIVSGGGTGGHIYPALAFIRYVQQVDPSAEFLYVGTEKGLESRIVREAGIPFESIEIQGFKRSLSLDNLKTVQLFIKAIKRSKEIVRSFHPDVVIGTGGYVCGAVVYAAAKLGVRTIIHEQNSVAGVTNKFLSHYADKVAICFKDVASDFPNEKVVLTGNPRAQEVVQVQPDPGVLASYQLDPSRRTALIFGGSRGALTINNAFKEAFDELAKRDYQVLYASGRYYYDDLEKDLAGKESQNISVQPYIDNMQEVLAAVDVTLARSGATSMAEITALGLPSILVPSPNVTNDHQTKNAMSLVNAGAAVLVRDDELDGSTLVQVLDDILLDDDRRDQMRVASANQGITDASERLYQLVKDLTSSH